MAVNLDNTLFVKSLMYKQQLLDQQRQERAIKEQQASQNMTQAMRDFQDMMKMYEASRQSSMEHALTLAQAQGKSAGQQGKDKPSFNTPEQQQGAEIGYGEGHRDFIKFAGEEAKWRVEKDLKERGLTNTADHYKNIESHNLAEELLGKRKAQEEEDYHDAYLTYLDKTLTNKQKVANIYANKKPTPIQPEDKTKEDEKKALIDRANKLNDDIQQAQKDRHTRELAASKQQELNTVMELLKTKHGLDLTPQVESKKTSLNPLDLIDLKTVKK